MALRWCGYGVFVLLADLVTGVIQVWLDPNVGIYGTPDNPIFSIPLGILLNLPRAAVHAAAGFVVTVLAELVDRNSRLLAHVPVFPILAGYPIYWLVRHFLIDGRSYQGAWFGVLEGALMTLFVFTELRCARAVRLRHDSFLGMDDSAHSGTRSS